MSRRRTPRLSEQLPATVPPWLCPSGKVGYHSRGDARLWLEHIRRQRDGADRVESREYRCSFCAGRYHLTSDAQRNGGGVVTHLEHGRCGACTRPATRFPSGRWEHDGRPCAARNGGVTFAHAATPPATFVPDGDDLPQPPRAGRWVPCGGWLAPGIPAQLEWIPPEWDAEQWATARAELAAEAERAS